MEMPLPGSITACSLRTASGPDVPVKPQSRTSGPDALGVTPTLSLKTRDDPCGRLLPGGGDGGMISVTVPAAASAISGVKSTLAMEAGTGTSQRQHRRGCVFTFELVRTIPHLQNAARPVRTAMHPERRDSSVGEHRGGVNDRMPWECAAKFVTAGEPPL